MTVPDGPHANLILVGGETTPLPLLGKGEALAAVSELIDAYHSRTSARSPDGAVMIAERPASQAGFATGQDLLLDQEQSELRGGLWAIAGHV